MKKFKLKTLLLFLTTAGLIGFFLGTLTLSFPVRWIVNYSVEQGLDKTPQDIYVKLTVGLFVLTTFLLAYFFTMKIIQSSGKRVGLITFFILIALSNTDRKLDTIAAFERGKIRKLGGKVYLTPFPTGEEYISFILSTDVKNRCFHSQSRKSGRYALDSQRRKITSIV